MRERCIEVRYAARRPRAIPGPQLRWLRGVLADEGDRAGTRKRELAQLHVRDLDAGAFAEGVYRPDAGVEPVARADDQRAVAAPGVRGDRTIHARVSEISGRAAVGRHDEEIVRLRTVAARADESEVLPIW